MTLSLPHSHDQHSAKATARLECSIYHPELDTSPGTIINPKRKPLKAFTLIELSITLVIIGLLVGGVLVGRDLISAAAVRAQISQIEKYQTAVNTFKVKYNFLPGDIPDPDATKFGFAARGTTAGEGDGNGIIQGDAGSGNYSGVVEAAGETVLFWMDLSTARLIDGNFSIGNPQCCPNSTPTAMSQFFPAGKIGNGNYLYVWSGGAVYSANAQGDGVNYFGISAISSFFNSWETASAPALTGAQAYAIDSKIDDSLPQSGRVQARYINNNIYSDAPVWAAGGGGSNAGDGSGAHNASPATGNTPGSATTCYDNNNVGGIEKYSMTQNNGTGMNCALSFKFQ